MKACLRLLACNRCAAVLTHNLLHALKSFYAYITFAQERECTYTVTKQTLLHTHTHRCFRQFHAAQNRAEEICQPHKHTLITLTFISTFTLTRCFHAKQLTVHSKYILSQRAPWELNPRLWCHQCQMSCSNIYIYVFSRHFIHCDLQCIQEIIHFVCVFSVNSTQDLAAVSIMLTIFIIYS